MISSAVRVTERFPVKILALEVSQEIRIKYRWQANDMKHQATEKAKFTNTKFESKMLSNGDTIK
ncbi:hypothetical protein SAMN05444395_1282 [Flavobacterium fryxellicola]|uniref:Uncharacterized protein n=1 Tax=Flavobacterium fryxellicola TaxID=249352 RepID=A0A167UY84_9FLAO|nr:hypothetical protein [Flavobacterium fryxellicola]OAB25909.1 hypothetical protein FBFR_13960 [Flavobacterium fryxellicola]SHN80429.1 hypothetical protein SAMN05444395_1282 [Flavobacterium fryxellicola]